MRVFHSVQYYKKRILLPRLWYSQKTIQVDVFFGDTERDDALIGAGPAESSQGLAFNVLHRNAANTGQVQNFAITPCLSIFLASKTLPTGRPERRASSTGLRPSIMFSIKTSL
jgi:hypothetical protein